MHQSVELVSRSVHTIPSKVQFQTWIIAAIINSDILGPGGTIKKNTVSAIGSCCFEHHPRKTVTVTKSVTADSPHRFRNGQVFKVLAAEES